ncbi:MAG: DUF3794 domain-containing protein [Clostridia bacterium]
MFKYEKLSLSKQATSPSIERVVEFSPPGVEMENITKVLSLSVDGRAMSVTAQDGYAEVEGRANFKLMYLDRDGKPSGKDYNADFSVKIDCDCHEGDSLSVKIDITEADVSAGETLTLSAVISVSLKLICVSEIEALVDAERCFKTFCKASVPVFKAVKSIVTPVEDEVMVSGDVESILLLDSRSIVKNATAGEGIIKVEGVVFACISYCDDGQIFTKQLEIPFVEEAQIDGVEPDDKVCVDVCVKGARIVLQGVTGDNIIRYEGEVALKMQVFGLRQAQLIDDLFMLTNEISVENDTAECRCVVSNKYFCERVTGTAQLSENRPIAKDIVCLPYARCYVSKAEVTEDGLTAEGIVNTDIVYTDENGYNSVRTEVPFSVLIAGEFEADIEVCCIVENIAARIKRDREIEVNMTLGICATEYKQTGFGYIKNIEVGAEKEQNTSGLSLYLASDGDEMWDICKALTATPEDIVLQNPTLETPLKQGEKVIYFRAINI